MNSGLREFSMSEWRLLPVVFRDGGYVAHEITNGGPSQYLVHLQEVRELVAGDCVPGAP